MTDQELIVRAIREAQFILAGYVEPGIRDPAKTIDQLLRILNQSDLVEAADRVEGLLGLRLPYCSNHPHPGTFACALVAIALPHEGRLLRCYRLSCPSPAGTAC